MPYALCLVYFCVCATCTPSSQLVPPSLAGSVSTPFLTYSITRSSPAQPVLVCDATGRISHASDAVAESFGCTSKQIMQQGNLLAFIPEIIGQLHMTHFMVGWIELCGWRAGGVVSKLLQVTAAVQVASSKGLVHHRCSRNFNLSSSHLAILLHCK